MALVVCRNTKCGKEFKPAQHTKGWYCSRSCAAVVNNSLSPKRKKVQKKFKDCLNCTGEVKSSGRKYCSSQCAADFRRAETVRLWKEGLSDGTTPMGFLQDAVRLHLLAEARNQCPRCGWGEPNPLTGNVTLTIDHKDGNSLNNSVENIEVLCYNCHTLTPTFNELNRGKGTRYTPGRRERDAQK